MAFRSGLSLLLVLFQSLLSLTSGFDYPEVCIGPYGDSCKLGGWSTSASGKRFANFQGIQYANSPVYSFRFKPPVPFIEQVNGLADVSAISNVSCVHWTYEGGFDGQEDCLLLNVYVPEKGIVDTNAKLPVMVWIYGGGFVFGSYNYNLYGPQYLIDKEVIVVSMNYRVAQFGFLSLGNEEVPGNAGLLDQVMALTWVQQNIAAFGGDPDAVTIFGESAGSFSVASLLVSPLAEGLFKRAICESGTSIAPSWHPTSVEETMKITNRFLEELECAQAENKLGCIQNQTLESIMRAGVHGWVPSLDSDFTSMPFFPANPLELLSSGQFNKNVEVIIGTMIVMSLSCHHRLKSYQLTYEPIFCALGEGIHEDSLYDPTGWDRFRETFDTEGVMNLFMLIDRLPNEQEVAKGHKLINFYAGSLDNINSNITEENLQGMVDYFTDGSFLYSSRKTLDYLREYGVTVYQYIFTYTGGNCAACNAGHPNLGVSHFEEVQFLWYSESNDNQNINNHDVMELMTTAWTNFAKTGNPSPPGSNFVWTPQSNNDQIQYLNISGPNPIMQSNQLIQDRMEFWDIILNE